MNKGLKENADIAIREEFFLMRIIRSLVRKTRIFIKKTKRALFGYCGNYYYGATAQDYENIRAKESWWHVENQVVSDILRNMPKGLSILDVPFGTGRFLPLYHERQMKVTGLDISFAMLDAARSLREDLVKQCQLDIGDVRNLPYENNSFDVVLSFRFLDGTLMFKDVKKALLELIRVSRKYLILEVFSVPDADDSRLVIKNLRENQPVNGRLSANEREKLFETSGMKVANKVSGAIEAGLRQEVYLCEKKEEISPSN